MSGKIRFAALPRVSTEKQEQRGESLRTQKKQIEEAVASLGGKVSKWYAGQEHATHGYERQLLDELLADAAKPHRPFDAVMVADASRWSRDNASSKEDLRVLRDNGVQFFTLTTEHDLNNPEAVLFLGMAAEFGEYQASTQKKKSMENRIERAKRGIPTGGKLPFGRLFDKTTEKWSIDPQKKEDIEDIAERYIAGESLADLAIEYSMNHTNLCKVLRERSGTEWSVNLDGKDYPIRVPALLPAATIRKVHARLKTNRTFPKKRPSKHTYHLSKRVRCAVCGGTMTGQANRSGKLYYRHNTRVECVHSTRWIPSQEIEQQVIRKLFETLGNPAAIERAINYANPDGAKHAKMRERYESDLQKAETRIQRLVDKVADGKLSDEEVDRKLSELRRQRDIANKKLDEIDKEHASALDPAVVKRLAIELHQVGDAILLIDSEGYQVAGGNDVASYLDMMRRPQDVASLLDQVFPEPEDGVYVTPGDTRARGTYDYELRGALPTAVAAHARHSRAPSPPVHRSRRRTARPRA